ncbi:MULTISPECIES: hypothetical protein [Clostridium]|uniref:hypothetical protein n=1 Tax=Clostridium TaxID=1485 RepID=UPI0002C8B9E9|nr:MULTISPECIES: hypothetical protein [Clostridium]APF21713.1 putative membrane protein [Clostridium butyricum]EMU52173.1 hypothetical protein CBDKU1_38500 [Clostridium butyricum DKU-01]ENZ32894.1 hypothetical protein HMPREF1084_02241 [Clostridium butyricum 60E.3]KJZ88787.1 hypothetical protein ClosIBUN125C_CONTIG19g01281 [Clostridium sp. IBUN125C]KJZ92471.1 hypothetical protein ClosIBUN22A_CONTIG169g03519 [Clostridium sp. IBUN22A]
MLFIICGLIVPIIFIIYNIICYLKRKVIYTINDSSLVIVDDRFFKLQLSLSLLNSLLVSVVVYIWEKQNLKFGILLFIMVYWGINYLIKYIGILKKYAQMKK